MSPEYGEMLKDAQAADMNPDASPGAAIAVAYIEGGPKLDPASILYWEAFFDLTTERPQAMAGALPIPFSKIAEYAQYWGLSQIASDRLIKVIKRVDSWYLAEAKRRQDNSVK